MLHSRFGRENDPEPGGTTLAQGARVTSFAKSTPTTRAFSNPSIVRMYNAPTFRVAQQCHCQNILLLVVTFLSCLQKTTWQGPPLKSYSGVL